MIKLSQKIREITFIRVSRFFLVLFLFCFPFQIQTYIYGGSSFITGNFSPYTTYFINLTDIFLALALLNFGIAVFRGEFKDKLNFGQHWIGLMLIILLIICFSGVLFSPDRILTFLLACRFALFGFLYLLVLNEVMSRDEIIAILIASILFQAIIAIAQYFLQRSVGLYFIGESHVAPDIGGVAKIDWNGTKIMRAYGTFPHANVLGGAIFMALVFSFYRLRDNLKFLLPAVAILILALVFTFSRSAFFALAVSFLMYISINEGKTALRYVMLGFSLLVFFVVAFDLEGIFFQRFLFEGDTESGLLRLKYLDIGQHMLINHPLGVGLGGYVYLMQNYAADKIMPWIFQPAHNVLMMAANELGIIGGLVFIVLIAYIFFTLAVSVMKFKKEDNEKLFGYTLVSMLAGIITISLFDHYFFTLYQGQALLVLFLALASGYLKKPEFPLRKS
jgi:hypothetical protein